MEINSIEKFLNANTKASTVVNIHFKNRATVTGIFISHNDYSELKAKNFWRLVVAKNIDKWKKDKKDMSIQAKSGVIFKLCYLTDDEEDDILDFIGWNESYNIKMDRMNY